MSDDGHPFSEEEIEIVEENNEVVEERNDEEELQTTENQQETTDATQTQEIKVKKVRNPQPKLDSQRLKGARGIQTIEGIFEKVKFKGRGHEEEDLKTVLRGYEYWCHRLFPKFKFEDCIEKIERLGSKKDVQTHIKKIRMNLLCLDEINDAPNDEEVESQQDPFNQLLTMPTQQSESLNTETEQYELSEEQLERIRTNRERALKRRRELIEQKNASAVNSEQSEDVNDVRIFETMDVSVEEANDSESHTLNANEFLTGEPSTSSVRDLEEE